MRGGWFFSFSFILVVIFLLIFYWFIPFNTIEFGIKESNTNFSLDEFGVGMQFYSNMRYSDERISYKINNCPLQKKEDMKRAFDIIEELTVLDFYEINMDEEISVTCESGNKIEGGLFIAGEGGPVNITQSGEFKVILNGKVLLIRKSECERPNVAIHELLHALGFDHSENKNNIMYNISKCNQVIGDDIVKEINNLYSIPSYPDLVFKNVSAIMNGRYLNLNMSVWNNGLKNSQKSEAIVYADEKIIKKIDMEPIEMGYGRQITLSNLWINKLSIDKLEIFINYSLKELDKENNKIVLEIK